MRRVFLRRIMALLAAGTFLGGCLNAAAPNPRVGFYQWVGVNPTAGEDLLTAARSVVRRSGAGLMRIYVGARFDYVKPAMDPGRFADLETPVPLRILQLPRYRALLEDPAIRTVVLTIYPCLDYGAGCDDINLLRPWGERERAAEYRQIFEAGAWLLETYGAEDKTVILANTETDDKLLEIMNYTGDPALALENLRQWQNTRYEAVDAVRAQHPGTRLRLLNAFEISLVNLRIRQVGGGFQKHPQGEWNCLQDVVPGIRFDLLSYSSYESTNSPYGTQALDTPPGGTGERLLRDIGRIRAQTDRPVMIGEIGFAWDRFEPLSTGGVLPRLKSALAALEKAMPAYVVFWQAFDAPHEGREPERWGWLSGYYPFPAVLRHFIQGFGAAPRQSHRGDAMPKRNASRVRVPD
jgi:hypothetical protein